MITHKFGERIMLIKKERNLTYKELCEITKVPKATMMSYTTQGQEPRAISIMMIAKGLGVSADWLLGLTDERN